MYMYMSKMYSKNNTPLQKLNVKYMYTIYVHEYRAIVSRTVYKIATIRLQSVFNDSPNGFKTPSHVLYIHVHVHCTCGKA